MATKDFLRGEESLPKLISSMHPTLSSETYVFLSIPQPLSSLLYSSQLQSLSPEMIFQETEGTTVITTRECAIAVGSLDSAIFPSKRISLSVHSDLEAVGLTAAVAKALAEAGISANVVAAFYHDHIFVPEAKGEDAMKVLRQLIAAASEE